MKNRSGRNKKSPAFQFYPSDFLSDGRAAAMTYEERGVFITLLSFAWLNGGIPSDPVQIQRLLRIGRFEFARVWPAISPCFDHAEGKPDTLVNNRMERERQSQADNREARKAASKLANEVRWLRNGSDSDPNRTPNGIRNDPTRLPSPVSRLPTPCVEDSVEGKPRPPVRKQRKEPTGPHAEFVAWWMEAFQKATGAPYAFAGAKDGTHVKTLLQRAGGDPEALRSRAMILLHSAPAWIAEGGKDLGTLVLHWNKLASQGTGVASGAKLAAVQAVNGSRHVPESGLLDLPTKPPARLNGGHP